jgi:hypothetical protein
MIGHLPFTNKIHLSSSFSGRRRRPPGGHTTAAGSGGQRARFSTDTASYTHTDCSLARPLLTYYSSPRPFSNGIFRPDSAPSSFPCVRTLLPSSGRSAGQRNQPSHSTVLARPVCPFVCVRAASFPCRFSDLGLNFLLSSAYCTRAQTLSLGSYNRPIAGKSSIPAGLSTLVYAYVVDTATASPYTYVSSTHRFPDERTCIEATPLTATSAELGLGLGLGLRLGSLARFSSHALPSSRHPPFTHYPFPPRSLVCGGQTSPHKPPLVMSHSTCPPLSSSPHTHSFVLGTAVINNNKLFPFLACILGVVARGPRR